MSHLDVRPGDVVGVAHPTGVAAVRLILALQWLGAIPVVVDHTLGPDTICRRLTRHGVRRLLITDRSLWEGSGLIANSQSDLDAVGPCEAIECQPNEIAFLQLTSGTSGEPRAATVTHANLLAELESARRVYALSSDDVFVSWLPLHHDFGLVLHLFGTVVIGATAHLMQPRLTNLRRWLRTIDDVDGTVTAAPDFAYRAATRLFAADDVDLSSLRVAICGGEPVRPSTVEAFEEAFSLRGVVSPAYGLAEATLGVTALHLSEPRRIDADGNNSCGPALHGVEVQIIDGDGESAPTGERGEIIVRGDIVFSGYWQDPDATAAVLRDGWLHTGDIGHLDADGHLYVTGRIRAMIKRAGRIIPARQVEEAVDAVAGVRRCGAIGSAVGPSGDEDLVVVAEVAGRNAGPELLRAIEAAVRDELGFAPPDIVLVARNSLPYTTNGKLRHVELRRQYEAGELRAL